MVKVVVTTEAIRCAKLQSIPTNQCRALYRPDVLPVANSVRAL